MEAEKARIGVFDPTIDYNVTLDGHIGGVVPPTEEEWEAMVGTQVVVDAIDSDVLYAVQSVDLSQSVYFPPVGDQELMGSCAAWSETYYAYGYLEAKDNDWTDTYLGNPAHLMSPVWTYNKQNGGSDDGSIRGHNSMVIRDLGAVTMDLMPYGSSVTDWGTEQAWREAPLHRIDDFYYLASNSNTIDVIKDLLQAGTPVNFGLNAEGFHSPYADYDGNRNNIISSYEYGYTDTNHAQTIVGYDDSVVDLGEVGAFKIVNSWGSSFGNGGYYYITYKAFLWMAAYTSIGFIVDLDDYQPSMLGVWHFNTAPTRDAEIEVRAVDTSSGAVMGSVDLFIDAGSSLLMPTFMCLDLSELAAYTNNPNVAIDLSVGASSLDGTLSSFKIEYYVDQYKAGKASMVSDQMTSPHMDTPCTVRCLQRAQVPTPIAEALKWYDGAFSYLGTAQWVEVPDGEDGAALQSGDVGDGGFSAFLSFVDGPGIISFDWKSSSENGFDFLQFGMDSTLVSTISGETGWSNVLYTVPSGSHILIWVYGKDGSVSSSGDCGWIDNVDWNGRSALLYDDFEGDQYPIWYVADSTSSSGVDYWGESQYRSLGGLQSAWCAQSGLGVNGRPNYLNHCYDQDMDSYMVTDLPSLTGLSDIHLSFYYWALTGTMSVADYAYLRVYDGATWSTVWTQPSTDSSGWTLAQVDIPVGTIEIAFLFHSDNTVGLGPYEGTYIDNVLLTALDSQAPASSIDPLSAYASSSVTLNVMTNDGAGSGFENIEIYYRHGTAGTYSLYTTPENPNGKWTVTSIVFSFNRVGDAEGTYQFYSVATDRAGNVETAPSTFDTSIVYDHTAPITMASLSDDPAPTWHNHDVTVSLSSGDSLSGVIGTSYRIDGGTWSTYSSTITITNQGSHVLEYRSMDGAGNVEPIHSVTVNIDTTTPTSSVSSITGNTGQNGWYRGAVVVTLHGQDAFSGVSMIEYRIDGSTWIVYDSGFQLSAEGSHVLEYRATDIAGNVEETKIIELHIDVDKPVTAVTLTGTAGLPGYYNDPVTVNLSASDANSGINKTFYRVDGGEWLSYLGNISLESEGNHVIEFFSTDIAGNNEAAKSVMLVVDTIAPTTTATLSGTEGTGDWYISSVTIALSSVDGISGVNQTIYRLDNGGWTAFTSAINVAGDGLHTIEYYSIDRSLNEETVHNDVIMIDTTKPSLEVLTPDGQLSTVTSFNILWTSSDSTSGGVTYQVSLDSGPFVPCSSTNDMLSGLSDGTHTIVIKAIDDAGNEALDMITVKVDTSLLSPTGPAGPMVLICILLAAVMVIVVGLIIWRRRKA